MPSFKSSSFVKLAPFLIHSEKPSPRARWHDAFSSKRVVPNTSLVLEIGELLLTNATSPK